MRGICGSPPFSYHHKKAAPLMRAKVKITIKTPSARSLRWQHTAFLTGNLALTRTSGAALRVRSLRRQHTALLTVILALTSKSGVALSAESSVTAYGVFDCDFGSDFQEWSWSDDVTLCIQR